MCEMMVAHSVPNGSSLSPMLYPYLLTLNIEDALAQDCDVQDISLNAGTEGVSTFILLKR